MQVTFNAAGLPITIAPTHCNQQAEEKHQSENSAASAVSSTASQPVHVSGTTASLKQTSQITSLSLRTLIDMSQQTSTNANGQANASLTPNELFSFFDRLGGKIAVGKAFSPPPITLEQEKVKPELSIFAGIFQSYDPNITEDTIKCLSLRQLIFAAKCILIVCPAKLNPDFTEPLRELLKDPAQVTQEKKDLLKAFEAYFVSQRVPELLQSFYIKWLTHVIEVEMSLTPNEGNKPIFLGFIRSQHNVIKNFFQNFMKDLSNILQKQWLDSSKMVELQISNQLGLQSVGKTAIKSSTPKFSKEGMEERLAVSKQLEEQYRELQPLISTILFGISASYKGLGANAPKDQIDTMCIGVIATCNSILHSCNDLIITMTNFENSKVMALLPVKRSPEGHKRLREIFNVFREGILVLLRETNSVIEKLKKGGKQSSVSAKISNSDVETSLRTIAEKKHILKSDIQRPHKVYCSKTITLLVSELESCYGPYRQIVFPFLQKLYATEISAERKFRDLQLIRANEFITYKEGTAAQSTGDALEDLRKVNQTRMELYVDTELEFQRWLKQFEKSIALTELDTDIYNCIRFLQGLAESVGLFREMTRIFAFVNQLEPVPLSAADSGVYVTTIAES